ncbi:MULTISPECIES: hypothetical protein [unclassified Tolypothrix]|uniref:hypothetical protein n=1 Tax=unclassified Tolypothrix TaxID=2649714 RepID=UPI0005EAB6EB|nr:MULTISPECIES: hypothetical protein [unclassified Tolypothrix]BAY93366.1 hypothetical protein NIES3275_54050 [Microchaete diplosiphon NIES-3275]EKF00141.1 hypothetical protein FDUTEX481_09349 [Tolypothrix sp. PCC 7601]MBE9085472.1 hypothetical protein [Tolypothrix sp. LEGE 11397]UYD27218.1 hypothetical protein HGR01_03700 [Tolypothrix sp. PCC 7712]UYD36922.1 hypothetical protein HG267_15045 [Tolypothrix sp. PCC 7601]
MKIIAKDVREIDSLIEELSDEELASCVGGCGWYNPAGNECEIETQEDGTFKITEYVLVGEQWNSSSYTTNSIADYWYDPNGSARYKFSY